MVNIVVNRGKVVELKDLPPKSIALDGYVQGPAIDLKNQRFSFDHHANCERHVTRATCEQVFDALALGFNPHGFSVYVNAVDADTVLSVHLLQNPQEWRGSAMQELVRAVGARDAHGPSYPLSLTERDAAEVFFQVVMGPAVIEHRNRTYPTCDLAALLEACLARCPGYAEYGTPATKFPQYRVLATVTNPSILLVESHDNVFPVLYGLGYTRVIANDVQLDGSHAYTIAKKSAFVEDFPVGPGDVPGTILHALAQVEPGWGGASTIGGAPRNPDGSRSRLPPEKVLEIVVATIEAYREERV